MPNPISSKETSLVILLGASAFPNAPNLDGAISFRVSYEAFKAYLLSPTGFGIKSDKQLLDLFDSPSNSSDTDAKIADWLKARVNEAKSWPKPLKNILVYYVGHGGFKDGSDQYFLAIRATRQDNPFYHSIQLESLAKNLRQNARHLRRFLIIDACFAAAAVRHFQSPLQEVVARKIEEIVWTEEQSPNTGTSLLCSSSSHNPSKFTDNGCTMFSGALCEVLKRQQESDQTFLSLQDLHTQTWKVIRSKFGAESIRPELNSPDQENGDIAKLPIFRVGSQTTVTGPPPSKLKPNRTFVVAGAFISIILFISILLAVYLNHSRQGTLKEAQVSHQNTKTLPPVTISSDNSLEASHFPKIPYTDIPPGFALYSIIENLRLKNLMPGYNDGTFGGSRPIIRYEVAYCIDLFVRRYARVLPANDADGFEKNKNNAPYPDVPENHWAFKALMQLKAENLSAGYPDGTFGGRRPATRYELCAMFEALRKKEFEYTPLIPLQGYTKPFADVPTDIIFFPSVESMRQYGVLRDYPDGTFGGRRPATRYEFAVMLDKFRQIVEAGQAEEFGVARQKN